jgi:hypothetical protein
VTFPNAGSGDLALGYYRSSVTERTYWKVLFEWTRTVPPPDDPLPQVGHGWTEERRPSRSGSLPTYWQAPPDLRIATQSRCWEPKTRLDPLSPSLPDSAICHRWHVLSVRDQMAGFVLPS